MCIVLVMPFNHLIRCDLPLLLNLLQIQGPFQCVSPHQAAKVLELQHQSLQ